MGLLCANEYAELAVHRALRGELAPWVHAVTADLAVEHVTLHVYHHAAPRDDWRVEFEQAVECEWDQVFPHGGLIGLPMLELQFHSATDFISASADPRLIYVSAWSNPAV